MKKLLTLFFLIFSITIFSEESKPSEPLVPMIPLLPSMPINPEAEGKPVPLEVKTIIMKMGTEIVVPLEIISDTEIQAMVIDDQKVVVPFEIEMNKEPDKKDYYKLTYSETEIDIDDDGKIDTSVYSNEYINSKIEKDNYVVIEGKNISKEGYHEKIIYLTVETHD